MGYFSWLDCKTGQSVKIGSECFLLIPADFGGGYIRTPSYGGYGSFYGHDVYELVAEWNRETLDISMLEEEAAPDQFGGMYPFEKDEMRAQGATEADIEKADTDKRRGYYEAYLRRRAKEIKRLEDYRNGTDAGTMAERYGDEWKRDIGIDIACYDEQNERLRYPIKVSLTEAVYEDCGPSKSDPSQGC